MPSLLVSSSDSALLTVTSALPPSLQSTEYASLTMSLLARALGLKTPITNGRRMHSSITASCCATDCVLPKRRGMPTATRW